MDESKLNDAKAVVILGLARSGSSVVTGVLRLLGVDVGAREYADKANPYGSFEDRDFRRLHREIFELARSGATYWDPPSRAAIMSLKERFAPRIKALICEKEQGKTLWGWKENRGILTIDLFLPYLKNPHLVVIFRNSLATARSGVRHTARHEDINLLHALRVGNLYHDELWGLLTRYPETPKILLEYEELVRDPRHQIELLANFLGVHPTDDQMASIEGFVIPREKIEQAKGKIKTLWGGSIPRFLRRHGWK
jgi:hypothetical protein